ncbi:MAG: hypothetical protein U0324_03850 [Polyangiales bacterium]
MTPPTPHYVRCVACGTWHRAWSRSGNTFGATTLWSDGYVTSTMLPAPAAVVARCASCAAYFWLDGAPRYSPPHDHHDPPPVTLVVTDAGPERVKVIHALRGVLGVPIAEARAIVDERRTIELDPGAAVAPSELLLALQRAGASVAARGLAAGLDPPVPSKAPDVAPPNEPRYLDALDAGVADTRERERTLRTLAWWLGSDPFRGTGRPWVDLESRAARVRENVERLDAVLDPADPGERLRKVECARQLGRFDDALALTAEPFPLEMQRAAGVLRALARQRDRAVAEVWTRR